MREAANRSQACFAVPQGVKTWSHAANCHPLDDGDNEQLVFAEGRAEFAEDQVKLHMGSLRAELKAEQKERERLLMELRALQAAPGEVNSLRQKWDRRSCTLIDHLRQQLEDSQSEAKHQAKRCEHWRLFGEVHFEARCRAQDVLERLRMEAHMVASQLRGIEAVLSSQAAGDAVTKLSHCKGAVQAVLPTLDTMATRAHLHVGVTPAGVAFACRGSSTFNGKASGTDCEVPSASDLSTTCSIMDLTSVSELSHSGSVEHLEAGPLHTHHAALAMKVEARSRHCASPHASFRDVAERHVGSTAALHNVATISPSQPFRSIRRPSQPPATPRPTPTKDGKEPRGTAAGNHTAEAHYKQLREVLSQMVGRADGPIIDAKDRQVQRVSRAYSMPS